MNINCNADALVDAIHQRGRECAVNTLKTWDHLQLEDTVLKLLERRNGKKYRVAFFCPTPGLENNFGEIGTSLESKGVEVHWLYGDFELYRRSSKVNKWIIVSDMAQRIKGIDAIVTASVMDILPDYCLHVLHDHLSFAHFDMDLQIERLRLSLPRVRTENCSNQKALFKAVPAFVLFLPFYDLVLTPSRQVSFLTEEALKLMGFRRDCRCLPRLAAACSTIFSAVKRESYVALGGCVKVSSHVRTQGYRRRVTVARTGYCKIDAAYAKYRSRAPGNVIVYAPTPTDSTGNKENDLWGLAVTAKEHGGIVLKALCQNFPDYQIIYKPYRGESPDVISSVVASLVSCPNFNVDFCGSDYWDLYSKCKVLVSDFSSTAYTFAIGLARPVVFYSPNEKLLPKEILNFSYCRCRKDVGALCETVPHLISSINDILENYTREVHKVNEFISKEMPELGGASKYAAVEILRLLRVKRYIYFYKRLGSWFKTANTFKAELVMQLEHKRTLQAIHNVIQPGRTVAFFCPDEAFRNNFGNLPTQLTAAGFVVLYLYGKKIGDNYESHKLSFYVGGGLIERIVGIDLILTPTIMDVLPNCSKKALLLHGSLAPFAPEPYENASLFTAEQTDKTTGTILERYEAAVKARTYFSAFARLYDYYLVSSVIFYDKIRCSLLTDAYQLGSQDGDVHDHFAVLTKALSIRGKSLPKTVSVVPCGYPKIDFLYNYVINHPVEKDTITFAPTPLAGKPSWVKYSALLNHGAEIIGELLENFSEYRIVFKPHLPDLHHPATLKIIDCFKGTRLIVDSGQSSYYDLYSRTAVMVSDFSSTAYTFSLGTSSPVVFYSSCECVMPEGLKNEAYCSLRTNVGFVVDNLQDLLACVHTAINDSDAIRFSIDRFRATFLYNVGNSEQYLVGAIKKMILGEVGDDWATFDNISPADKLANKIPDDDSFLLPPRLVCVLMSTNIVLFKGRYYLLLAKGLPVDLYSFTNDELDKIPSCRNLSVAKFFACLSWFQKLLRNGLCG